MLKTKYIPYWAEENQKSLYLLLQFVRKFKTLNTSAENSFSLKLVFRWWFPLRTTWESCSGSHANGPKNSFHRGFFFFWTSTVFFPLFLKYSVVFQDQSEDYIGEGDIFEFLTWLRSLYFVLWVYSMFYCV